MSRWQGKSYDWNCRDQANETKRRRGMGSCIYFPFDRDGEHLSPGDRDEIAKGVKRKSAKPKGSVGIAD